MPSLIRPTREEPGSIRRIHLTAFELVIGGTPRAEIATRLKKRFVLDGEDDDELLERTLEQAVAKGANWSTGQHQGGQPPRRRPGFLRR